MTHALAVIALVVAAATCWAQTAHAILKKDPDTSPKCRPAARGR
jgi:hypothetical protein